jgi:hypothetical protein
VQELSSAGNDGAAIERLSFGACAEKSRVDESTSKEQTLSQYGHSRSEASRRGYHQLAF